MHSLFCVFIYFYCCSSTVVSYSYFYNQVVVFRLTETMLLIRTTHKGGHQIKEGTKELTNCLENNNCIILPFIKLKLYIYSLHFFHLLQPVPAKTSLKCWVFLGDLWKFILLLFKCNVAIMTLFVLFVVRMTSVDEACTSRARQRHNAEVCIVSIVPNFHT